jgi:hypothetical protein
MVWRSKPSKRTVFGKQAYLDYLQSDTWKQVKLRYLKSKSKKRCYVCWKPYENNGCFDFHHKTYKNLGCERLMDLVILCRNCHEDTHRIVAIGRSRLWGAARVLRRHRIGLLKRKHGITSQREARLLIRTGKISLTELLT